MALTEKFDFVCSASEPGVPGSHICVKWSVCVCVGGGGGGAVHTVNRAAIIMGLLELPC